MQKTALPFQKSSLGIDLQTLRQSRDSWLLDGEIRQHSKATLENRRLILEKLLWFLDEKSYETCGLAELRQFLAYLGRSNDEGGRWGNPQVTRAALPSTVQTYYRHLRTFFAWMVTDGIIEVSPMDNLRTPLARADQIQPFTSKQIDQLLIAARQSNHAKRDEAIVLFLLDTGVRASELCGIKMGDIDLQSRRCTIHGKGNKSRSIYFGRGTSKAICQYLKATTRRQDDFLFVSDRGEDGPEPLTRSGLAQIIRRLGRVAEIEATRCSPHTFRHSFSIEFLRAGGIQFALMSLLGHTDLKMTARYVHLAQADVEHQHRQFSPVDRLKGRAR